MGKVNMGADKGKLKEIARRKKERADKEKEKEKLAASNLKRKETSSSLNKGSISSKKQKLQSEVDRVDPGGDRLAGSAIVAVSSKGKEKESVRPAGEVIRSISGSKKVKVFVDDVMEVLDRIPLDKPSSNRSDTQNLRLAFNKSAEAFFAQHELLCKLERMEDQLRGHIGDLTKQLGEAEDEVEALKAVVGKRDAQVTQLEMQKIEAEAAFDALKSDLASCQQKHSFESEILYDQIAGLHERIDLLSEEVGKLKRGEEVDLEAVIDSKDFNELKECMDEAVADNLIKKIQQEHPEWDVSFLTKGRVDRDALEVDRSGEASGGVDNETGPTDHGKEKEGPDVEGGST